MKKILKYKITSPEGIMPIEVKIIEQSHRSDAFGNSGIWFEIKSIKYFLVSASDPSGDSRVSKNICFVRGINKKCDNNKMYFDSKRKFSAFEKLVKAYNEYDFKE